MTLRQDGTRVTGSYGRNGAENAIEGTVETDKLTFRYEASAERGIGWLNPAMRSISFRPENNMIRPAFRRTDHVARGISLDGCGVDAETDCPQCTRTAGVRASVM